MQYITNVQPITYANARQLALPLSPLNEVEYRPEMTISERFQMFHEANPQVFETLKEMALRLKRRGLRTYGVRALFEALRFEYNLNIRRVDEEDFRLNNDYTALYARKLMAEVPELRGFFVIRTRRAE